MATTTLRVSNVGPIKRADVEFGDLTVLVGPQATGKSILLQLLKLLVDTGAVLEELKRHGLNWGKDVGRFLDVYLGEGMHGVWDKRASRIVTQDGDVDLSKLVERQRRDKRESLFYIPAQRVLTLRSGWPRPFTDYSPGDPFVVRDYSEKLRGLMDTWSASRESLFFPTFGLKEEIWHLLLNTVFYDFRLCVDQREAQKRLMLARHTTAPAEKGAPRLFNIVCDSLPSMVWSAGQREFVPLLLGFCWLLRPTKVSRRADIQWAVIEEPEMGLHPRAISATLLLVLDLLARDYRVCISTHSPHVLDVVWALRMIRRHGADSRKVLELFDVKPVPNMKAMAEKVLEKDARVYYFDAKSGEARDISDLDPASEDAAEAGWGGLTEFSGRVADVVAGVVGRSTE